jgi:hypothetical protein
MPARHIYMAIGYMAEINNLDFDLRFMYIITVTSGKDADLTAAVNGRKSKQCS